MSAFSTIKDKLKEMIQGMFGKQTIERTLNVAPVISSQMEQAITLWSAMYKNEAPWLHEPTDYDHSRVTSLGLPAMIASEKARMALIEMEMDITTPTEEVEKKNPDYKEPEEDIFGNIIPSMQPEYITEDKPKTSTDRAEYLNDKKEKLIKDLRRVLEYAIAKGGLVIKPYIVIKKSPDKNETTVYDMEFDYIQADCFYPLAFDASGNITEAAFLETKCVGEVTYRKLEYHKWENNSVTVKNKAFKSTTTGISTDNSGVDLGQEVSLKDVPEWKDLPPSTTIAPIEKPLFAYFKMPEANTVDTTSPLGVSGFSRAVGLIKDADRQYSTLLWEYEGGQMAIDIDRDALQFVENEGSKLSQLQNRLYRPVDLGESDTYHPYAPQLRDSNYIEGLNTILMRIEDVCCISRGTLSDGADVARTATELKILKQRSYQANKDIQDALEKTLDDVVYIMNAYCDLYQITPDGEYDVSYQWDDSILVDIDEELNKKMMLLQNGLMSKLELRQWYFGETERQAQDALTKMNEENMQDMENDLIMQTNQFNQTGKFPNNSKKNENKKPENND